MNKALILDLSRIIKFYATVTIQPKESKIYRYYTCVFEQPNKIDVNTNQIDSRPKFDLNSFVKSNNLVIKGCFKFRVEG